MTKYKKVLDFSKESLYLIPSGVMTKASNDSRIVWRLFFYIPQVLFIVERSVQNAHSYNLKSISGKGEISYERKKKCFRNVRM